ncbi:MAG: hypothetical protein H7Y14_10870 [Burkholderiales bacterium]|nr:hypothetical protein [Burkholderiales bacterium]
MNRALLSALAVCFAVAGCDSQKPAEPPKPNTSQAVVPQPDAKPQQVVGTTKAPPPKGRGGCGGGRCVVKITVDDTVTPCKVSYSTEHLSVFGPNTIRWTAQGGWLFEKDGIVFPTGSGQFSNPTGGGSATFAWTDANTDKLKYKYTVNLKKGAKKCKNDPSVVNGADFEDPNYP